MMRIGSVFEQTSTTEFVVMLDQQHDNEQLLFSYIEIAPDGQQPNPNGERIIARVTSVHKENPLLSRDQAIVTASISLDKLGIDFSRRFTHGWAKCTVIGSLTKVGLDMNRRVVAPNAAVHTPSKKTFEQLFFKPEPSYVPLGTIETFGDKAIEEVPVTLNADQLVTKHFCIFGMTGSGKTNTSAKLLEELMARGHRMIIFDSHDDYLNLEVFTNMFRSSDAKNNQSAGLSAPLIHAKAVEEAIKQFNLNPNDLVDGRPLKECIYERIIRAASVVSRNTPVHKIIQDEIKKLTPDLVSVISQLEPWNRLISNYQVAHYNNFPELRFYGNDFVAFSINLLEAFQGEDFSDAQKRWLRNNIDQQGTGISYLRNLWTAVRNDRNLRDETKTVLQQKFNALQAIYNDAIKSSSQPLDLENFFLQVADRNTQRSLPQTVYRLSLSNLSSNLRKALVYGIVTYCFRKFKFGDYHATPKQGKIPNAYPILFVLEEARSLIPKSSSDDIDVSGKLARRAMREIAYEGRKFSLGFGLISQKPSTVDSEVVSQANTFILHQLKSPDDQRYVRDVTEGMSDDELEMVKSLGKGRAIVTGTAVNSSVLLRVYFRYSAEGIQEPTPIANELSSISQIRKQLGID